MSIVIVGVGVIIALMAIIANTVKEFKECKAIREEIAKPIGANDSTMTKTIRYQYTEKDIQHMLRGRSDDVSGKKWVLKRYTSKIQTIADHGLVTKKIEEEIFELV